LSLSGTEHNWPEFLKTLTVYNSRLERTAALPFVEGHAAEAGR